MQALSAHTILSSGVQGFVEFDDVNSKILTFSTDTQEYKVWSLVNYRHLFTIRDPRVQEIKISPNIMLLIFPRSSLGGYIPLQILDMETGKLLREFNHLLHRHKKIDFIEQFNEKLLVKQDRENLQIVDVATGGVVEVVRSQFLTPNAFIFLYDTQMFITFRNRVVSAWNFLGELVTNFEDHELWFSDCQGDSHNANNNIYVLSQQVSSAGPFEPLARACSRKIPFFCAHDDLDTGSDAAYPSRFTRSLPRPAAITGPHHQLLQEPRLQTRNWRSGARLHQHLLGFAGQAGWED